MSKIVILLDLPVSAAQRVVLARLTGRPLMEVGQSVGSGEPLITRTLFMNDSPDVTTLLIALMRLPLNLRCFELDEDAAWTTPGDHAAQEIAPETLMNILRGGGISSRDAPG
ncbi:hypothetical protein [Deinococcus altitudinis]|uniref:hypothetical protein n=1 Tax=Deinococcus altitudinis TaxID=468914 RepID=UPI0038924524